MPENTRPWKTRSLDSFSDDIIVYVRQNDSNKLWYATIDAGAGEVFSVPDFSACSDTKAKAISACARLIRDDACGTGKYAPHDILANGVNSEIKKHWLFKESLAAEDIDYSSIREYACQAGHKTRWQISGSSRRVTLEVSKNIEFAFAVACLTGKTTDEIMDLVASAGAHKPAIKRILDEMSGHELMAMRDPATYMTPRNS